MTIKVELAANKREKPDQNKLGFGRFFTDHMFIMEYDKGQGWHDARIVPFSNLSLSPASMCLHYGQEVFEGLKAYKAPDGRILLFRPDKNMERMNVSNDRVCIPPIDEEFCVEAIKLLVKTDQDWIPEAPDTSLYIRPFIIAVDPFVGVKSSEKLLFVVILSPVGAYYPEGLNPVKICVEENYVRAVRGGTGFAKTAANYAASLKAQVDAAAKSYSQVLWLDGIERKYIEEVGTMNVFFAIDDEVVTPALQGSILSGITRMSVIDMLRLWGIEVVERAISIDELWRYGAEGRLKEAFGTGTAAVVSPIGELNRQGDVLTINNGEIGQLSQRLYDELTAIQNGRVLDPFGWTVEV